MFKVMHQFTKADSLSVKNYLAINLILILILRKVHCDVTLDPFKSSVILEARCRTH